MTLEEAKAAYIEKFGGYPAFLLMGADDDEIIASLTKCLETGEELQPDDDDNIY